jgi:hypothetical protein
MIQLPLPLLILQHPQEPSRKDSLVSSARLLEENLSPAHLAVGLSWRNLESALKNFSEVNQIEELLKPSAWATLYLGTKKQSHASHSPDDLEAEVDLSAMEPGLYFLDKKGNPKDDSQSASVQPIGGLILLDGTWAQAKTMWWRNAWLLKTQRIHLIPKQKSLYGNIRKEPRPECVSTLEAAAETLSFLGIDENVETTLKSAFQKELDAFKKSKKGPPQH